MNNNDTGFLLNAQNIKLQRDYFKQMCNTIGIKVLHRKPRKDKHYNGYGELDSYFFAPEVVGCIFNEHPDQKTMRKLGWNSELEDSVSLIQVPYDTPVENGSLFIVPSGLDNAQGRLFRVILMSNIAVYPAYITCQIAPVLETTYEEGETVYKDSNFSLLATEEDDEEEY